MKKWSAIVLLTIYVISLTELHQLIKLPLLVQHFIEHKSKDNSMSLWAFLDMHYAHGDVRDADYDEDMKLPFKTHDGCINSFSVAFIPNNFCSLPAKPVHVESKSYSIYKENFFKSSYLSFIWQPPKSC